MRCGELGLGISPNSTRDAAADWVESENRRREGEEGKGGGMCGGLLFVLFLGEAYYY